MEPVRVRVPTVAVIMPAFNEADRIDQTIRTIAAYRRRTPTIGPVYLADDGSTDATIEVARKAAHDENLPISVLSFAHRGKALTVKAGMLHAANACRAEYLMMLDADDELSIDQLDRIDWSDDPHAIYIGQRASSGGASNDVRPSAFRRLMSFGMHLASRTLLGIPFRDTQCGFKLFPRSVAAELFAQQRSAGWTFDAELLLIAHRISRLPVQPVEVTWRPRGISKVGPGAVFSSVASMIGTALHRLTRAYRPIAVPGAGPSARQPVAMPRRVV